MRVLVTGADGFVGSHLLGRLVGAGHRVVAACRPSGELERWIRPEWQASVQIVPFELSEATSVRAAVADPLDAVVHLAAVASSREAHTDPARAWVINAAGTALLVDALLARRETGNSGPVVLIVSSGEVYGSGPPRPRVEADPLAPQSPYAASKVGTEAAGLEAWRRAGLRVIIARPFIHTGPGQRPPYVVPSFVQRLLAAKASGSTQVATGNLEPVRDLLDVRDVVEAYLRLLTKGEPGETYNIARGQGTTLRELFRRVAALIGTNAEPVSDPQLARRGDIPYLVGDPRKLERATGWSPTITLEQTLRDMVDAQAH